MAKNSAVQQVKDTLITGTVTDNSDDAPLPGVTVKVPNSRIGVTTDAKGKYALRAPRNVASLIFSSIGYKTQNVSVTNGQTGVNVALEPDVASINSVQVIA